MDALKTLQLIDYIEFELPSRKLKNKNYGLLKILKNPYGFIKDEKQEKFVIIL